jgi:hypothetical protein
LLYDMRPVLQQQCAAGADQSRTVHACRKILLVVAVTCVNLTWGLCGVAVTV